MKVLKCKNGHFFDGDTYSTCPHCGASVSDDNTAASAVEESRKKGLSSLFNREEKHSKKRAEIHSEPLHTEDSSPDSAFCVHKDVSEKNHKHISAAAGSDAGDKTMDVWRSGVADGDIVPQPEPSGGSSLLEEVRKVSATEEGKTMSYFSAMTGQVDTAASAAAPEKAPAASAVSSQATSSEPVVGWLVCISGGYIGNSFNLYAGKNTIGRDSNNRLVLANDKSISRNKHAIIVYEPKKRNFFLQPGDSTGLTYLNDDYIDQSAKLKPRDIIELGSTKLLFVPLCDDNFSWEDYINKE